MATTSQCMQTRSTEATRRSGHRDFENRDSEVSDDVLLEEIQAMLDGEGSEVGTFFQESAANRNKEISKGLLPLCLELSNPACEGGVLSAAVVNNLSELDLESKKAFTGMKESFMTRDRLARNAFMLFKGRINPDIWNCCSRLCFASIAVDAKSHRLMQEFILIHEYAEQAHAEMEQLGIRLEKRRRGIGTSHIAFRSRSRPEREAESGAHHETRRREQLNAFADFVAEVLPFLYGKQYSPRQTPPPPYKVCTEAICCLLGVSRNFLYYRKQVKEGVTLSEDELLSIVDSAGVRLRQHRRLGVRMNYPPVQDLQDYDCGCDTPCFSETPVWTLVSEYDEFCTLSKQLNARHKENCYLLNKMYNPLGNTTTKVCNNSLAALYNVSPSLISSVRSALDALCDGPDTAVGGEGLELSSQKRILLNNGLSRYKYDRGHPLNRYPDSIREQLERHLDMVLRADPEGSNGYSVCRVYSPEINTYQKLRNTLKESLELGEGFNSELSAATIQRMVQAYLKKRNFCSISFSQSDHNACPTCKVMQYAVLQFDYERKRYQQSLGVMLQKPRPFTSSESSHLASLSERIEAKSFQLENCMSDLQKHTSRDARIREALKSICDYFFKTEESYRGRKAGHGPLRLKLSADEGTEDCSWNSQAQRARITHQDDMTKVDLPHFFVEASADITRWRFDVDAHVNAVTGDAIVFSHEQGGGPKNASLIIEEILLEHILACRGESIKFVISDNASVGKNWATTIALPQYIVDQGLAEIVVMVFLENNHGKWLADMLFGQFQTRRKRTTLLSVDDMLAGFESIKRKNGKIRGFALNPLSCVDFVKVFASLGYETAPPSKFGFLKRNIHFAAACRPGAKRTLSSELSGIIGPLLPDDRGMVRISTEPPSKLSQQELPYEQRYLDVPAARTSTTGSCGVVEGVPLGASEVPLVVPLDKTYSPGGSGVVSHRTSVQLGYNGIEFSKSDACVEMRHTETQLVRRAWPKGMLKPYGESEEPVYGVESTKCAPVNWIVREPVHHFTKSENDWKARYPPRNLLNAKFKRGPRVSRPWTPVSTYEEPPFPIIENTAAFTAMRALSRNHSNLEEPIHTLELLREVFREMEDREDVADPWLQRSAALPSQRALATYRSELEIYASREEGHPKAPITMKLAFRQDTEVAAEVQRKMCELGSFTTAGARRRAEEETVSKLFSERLLQPGRMDRFQHMVELDHERYASELKRFKEQQRSFDESRGLSPRISQA